MDQGLATLIGMSIAYVACFMGMGFAYIQWRRRQEREEGKGKREKSGGRS